MDQHREIGCVGSIPGWKKSGGKPPHSKMELSTREIVLDDYLSVNKNATGKVGAAAILNLTCMSWSEARALLATSGFRTK